MPAKKKAPPAPQSKAAEVLEKKRAAQKARADESAHMRPHKQGPPGSSQRGPGGRTRGPVKK